MRQQPSGRKSGTVEALKTSAPTRYPAPAHPNSNGQAKSSRRAAPQDRQPPPDPAPHPAPDLAFDQHLDGINDACVWGWLSDPADRTRRLVVVLSENGQVLARTAASQFRKDVRGAGVGDGCYGFTTLIPESLRDGRIHSLDVTEESTGRRLGTPLRWQSGAPAHLQAHAPISHLAEHGPALLSGLAPPARIDPAITVRMLFDISDLVYYLGHHPNLSGIQRVQSGIVLAMLQGARAAHQDPVFLSFSTRRQQWIAIPAGFLVSLLQDLFLPRQHRIVPYPVLDAQAGELPGCHPFDGEGVLDDGIPSTFCLLGAAWGQPDYFRRILAFKRRFQTRLVVMVHDLIPIYAGHTCDRGTVRVFEDFLWRALHHVDHFLAVSESTARDLARYAASVGRSLPPVTVTRNGSSFSEFMPRTRPAPRAPDRATPRIPDRFVLFVSTVEGRKNHAFMLDVWRRMADAGQDPPHLVCVGRVGWRSERFLSGLAETDHLGGRIVILQDIDDALLETLYERCLFTVYPSLYEGWGLPIGESLAAGKICVCSDRTSLPEVAGECGVYIDIEDPAGAARAIHALVADEPERRRLEASIRDAYRPITWHDLTRTVMAACEAALPGEWAAPYPVAAVPWGTEISFARLSRETDEASGEEVLRRSAGLRRGYLLNATLREPQFLAGEEVRVEGLWAQPEPWGTWLCKGPGDVLMALPPTASDILHVFLRLRASEAAGGVQVRLLADGELVWAGAIGSHTRTIPLRILRRPGLGDTWSNLRLRSEMDLSREDAAAIAAIDARMPILGFERLVAIPGDDLATRLDVLTNLLR